MPAVVPPVPKASLSLDQIGPAPRLAKPFSGPSSRPSVDSLVLFAQARDLLDRGARQQSIALLSSAAKLDPTSYAIQYELGCAYAAVSQIDERSTEAFARATVLDPDHLDVQTRLGRQYLRRGNIGLGLKHLRLARQTSEYRTDDAGASLADFFLARGLKQVGYDRAALQVYDTLVHRLGNPSLEIRQNPELTYLLIHPDLLYVDLGELYERVGNVLESLKAYRAALEQQPANLAYQEHVARLLATLGRKDEALSAAAAIVVRTRASFDSLALLNDVCRRLYLEAGAVDALARLHADHPQDRPVLFALVDALLQRKQNAKAETLIAAAWNQSPGDIALTRRFVHLSEARNDTKQAARVLVIALSRSPESLNNLSPLWTSLLRPTRSNRLTMATLQAMEFSPAEEAARQFWVSRVADLYHRDALALSALTAACQPRPPFAPAFRERIALAWADDRLSNDQKADLCGKIVEKARSGGDPVLADALAGLSLLKQGKKEAAASALARAVRGGDGSPQLLLDFATAARRPGKDAQFETLLWKIITEHPLFENAYADLFRYYAGLDGGVNDALRVVSSWLAADPSSVSARLLDADAQLQLHQTSDAEATLNTLFDEDPDNIETLAAMQVLYTRANRLDTFISKLEVQLAADPRDVRVAGRLASIYLSQRRFGEATRLVDATRNAVADDAESLYAVSELYTLLNQKAAAEDVLRRVLTLDPTHAGANNDLGYSWADEGRHLLQAERMIRDAVLIEPDNQTFLDSLGWVLYKRGKLAEARLAFEKAIGPAAFPDPVVLNHLGDALYRLNDTAAASKQWQRSLKDLGETDADRDDLRQLRLQLLQKLKATEAHQPADVAPIASS